METTVVTGATSSIGREIVKNLIDKGNIVHAFVRDIPKSKKLLPINNKNLNLIEFDWVLLIFNSTLSKNHLQLCNIYEMV